MFASNSEIFSACTRFTEINNDAGLTPSAWQLVPLIEQVVQFPHSHDQRSQQKLSRSRAEDLRTSKLPLYARDQ